MYSTSEYRDFRFTAVGCQVLTGYINRTIVSLYQFKIQEFSWKRIVFISSNVILGWITVHNLKKKATF